MSLRHFPSLDAALVAEEALFDRLSGGRVAHAQTMWIGHRALVMPRRMARSPRFAPAAALSAAAGWPVVLRQTGGGIVPQGPGMLNLALAWTEPARPAASIASGYAKICDPIRTVLGGTCASVSTAFCDGAFNVVVDGRKVAGTAQRRRSTAGRTSVLAHAAILVDEDIDAGVAATNAFREMLGDEPSIRSAAHINAVEVLGDWSLTPARLAQRLADVLATHAESHDELAA